MAVRIQDPTPDLFEKKGHPIYDWSQWQDGSVWRITHGIDFSCEPRHMRTQMYMRATKTGQKVRTTIARNNLTFQFYQETNQ